jgi:hypothetical protein
VRSDKGNREIKSRSKKAKKAELKSLTKLLGGDVEMMTETYPLFKRSEVLKKADATDATSTDCEI